MSIFDRLISTLTGGESPAAPAPAAPAPAAPDQVAVDEGEEQPRRFMGRDGVKTAAPAPVVERGLEPGTQIWLHVQPTSQRLLLVSGLGVASGVELNPTQAADLHHAGWCEEVAYHAGYDQYWKMPSQEAILRTPSLFQIPAPLMNRMKLETRLVKQGEPRGFWMRVRIRTAEEIGPKDESLI